MSLKEAVQEKLGRQLLTTEAEHAARIESEQLKREGQIQRDRGLYGHMLFPSHLNPRRFPIEPAEMENAASLGAVDSTGPSPILDALNRAQKNCSVLEEAVEVLEIRMGAVLAPERPGPGTGDCSASGVAALATCYLAEEIDRTAYRIQIAFERLYRISSRLCL